jgi:hypothetical protein
MAEPAEPGGSSFRELAHKLVGGDRATDVLSSLADQLGLARERRLEELELRIAQLEHRLRLLEQSEDAPSKGP